MDLSPLAILDAAENYRGEFVDLDAPCVVSAADFRSGRDRLAARLAREGLASAPRVIVAVGNGPKFIATLVAVLMQGGSPVLVHPKTPAPELKRTALRHGARMVIAAECEPSTLEAVASSVTTLSVGDWIELSLARIDISGTGADAHKFNLPGVPLHPTSGTTGLPRVAVRPGFAAAEEARHYIETIGVTAADTIVAVAPMCHAYAYGMCVMVPLLSNARVVSMTSFQVGRVFHALEHERVTILPAVPAMLDVLIFAAGERLRGAVRTVLSAGSPLSERTASRFHKKSGIRVRPLYGTTETGGITVASIGDEPLAPNCVGAPMQGVKVMVRAQTESSGAQHGVGRLHVRSSSMMAGYMATGGIDASPLDDGWFATGDLAWIDSASRIHLMGRETEVINVAGLKVIPCEVEEVVGALPGVLEVKVYAGQRRNGSQFIKAAVVSETPLDLAAIRSHCEAHLVYYKRPERFIFIERLPRSATGKILREQLP
jgi:acyl-CoA synthetase (AMP-forming)/AMP-acid ligase II